MSGFGFDVNKDRYPSPIALPKTKTKGISKLPSGQEESREIKRQKGKDNKGHSWGIGTVKKELGMLNPLNLMKFSESKIQPTEVMPKKPKSILKVEESSAKKKGLSTKFNEEVKAISIKRGSQDTEIIEREATIPLHPSTDENIKYTSFAKSLRSGTVALKETIKKIETKVSQLVRKEEISADESSVDILMERLSKAYNRRRDTRRPNYASLGYLETTMNEAVKSLGGEEKIDLRKPESQALLKKAFIDRLDSHPPQQLVTKAMIDQEGNEVKDRFGNIKTVPDFVKDETSQYEEDVNPQYENVPQEKINEIKSLWLPIIDSAFKLGQFPAPPQE